MKPKFKVGDWVRRKSDGQEIFLHIKKIGWSFMHLSGINGYIVECHMYPGGIKPRAYHIDHVDKFFVKCDPPLIGKDALRMTNMINLKEERDNAPLKPCPFCPSQKAEILSAGLYALQVMCYKCDCKGPPARTEREARAAWNRRSHGDL